MNVMPMDVQLDVPSTSILDSHVALGAVRSIVIKHAQSVIIHGVPQAMLQIFIEKADHVFVSPSQEL